MPNVCNEERYVTSYLQRYLTGEHEAVWSDLRELGGHVRAESVYQDANAVARETMRRVRQNIELLIPRLLNLGYHFDAPLVPRLPGGHAVYSPPRLDVGEWIEKLERGAGSLPLALRAWYEVVGSVDLVGRFPAWDQWARKNGVYLDQLMLSSVEEALLDYEAWREDVLERGPKGVDAFAVPLTPDVVQKAGYSGSGPYCIRIPDDAADASWTDVMPETPLVEYLRIAIRWGGFPGFGEAPDPPGEIAELTAGLLLF